MGILKTILLLLGPKGAAMHLSVDLFHIKRTTRLDNAKDHFLESIVMIFYLQCFSWWKGCIKELRHFSNKELKLQNEPAIDQPWVSFSFLIGFVQCSKTVCIFTGKVWEK